MAKSGFYDCGVYKNLWVVYLFIDYQSIHIEAVTANREIVANHLAYTHLYMFLVAEYDD